MWRVRRQALDDDLRHWLRRQQVGVERVALFCEADVFNRIGLAAHVARAAELARLRRLNGRGAFAVDLPRAAAEDAFAVRLHPLRHTLEECDFVLVYRAIAPDRHTEHEVTVLAHNVEQHIYDLADRLVP